jgi:hypothetical protein
MRGDMTKLSGTNYIGGGSIPVHGNNAAVMLRASSWEVGAGDTAAKGSGWPFFKPLDSYCADHRAGLVQLAYKSCGTIFADSRTWVRRGSCRWRWSWLLTGCGVTDTGLHCLSAGEH